MLNVILRLLLRFKSRQALILENIALRHQIEVLQRNSGRPRLFWRDRAFWDVLSCIWPDWRKTLYIVQPETVVRWHRKGFRYYWRWKSRPLSNLLAPTRLDRHSRQDTTELSCRDKNKPILVLSNHLGSRLPFCCREKEPMIVFVYRTLLTLLLSCVMGKRSCEYGV